MLAADAKIEGSGNGIMATDERPTFGELLRRYRLAAGLTQETLAERAGLSVRGLSDLERGARRVPHPDTVRRLVQVLDLSDAERAVLRAVRDRHAAAGANAGGAQRAPPPAALLAPPTSFVGRERELAEVRRLLGTARLLTLTGTGGIGKTRLALQVAGVTGPAFADGMVFVNLAPLEDAALVPRAVAATLGSPEDPGRPLLSTLADDLRPKQLLLGLDNCEHVVGACAELTDHLLRTCPRLKILATSRELLGIAGEVAWRVPSLAAPGPADEVSIERLAQCDSVRLFLERAASALPDFILTEQNGRAVSEVCRRLDGIPLAIELAAARVAVLSPEQIAERLDDRFRLLTGGSRTALPRYRTLQALVDWSHDLLDEQERVLLRRLAVFAGGWTLEAAEAVCAGDGLAQDDVLDLLSGLVAKSLVLAGDGADAVRYRFLETLREYAAERLRDAGEESRLRARHRDWFLALAERAEPELRGPRSVAWLDRLERERENLRAALGWCVERAEADPGLRLAGALARFWLVRGPYREARCTLAELLSSPAAHERTTPILAARVDVLLAAGRLALRQDDQAAADAAYQEALEISRGLGDRRGLAMALYSIANLARVRGEYSTARSHHAEAIQLFEALSDDHWLATTHHDLGIAAYFEGDLTAAHEQYEAALALSRGLGDELGIASALNELGEVALLRGELDEARALEGTCLAMARRIDDKKLIAMSMAALAGLAAAQSRPTHALRLAGTALALNEATGQRNSPAWHAMLERWLLPARQALSVEACAAAQASGQSMSLDEAIEDALASDTQPAAEMSRHAALSSRAASRLTPREHEVAALVSRGLTNRQIAAELIIAEGTVANHVKHILAKLGLDSRVQVPAWVTEHGLHRPTVS